MTAREAGGGTENFGPREENKSAGPQGAIRGRGEETPSSSSIFCQKKKKESLVFQDERKLRELNDACK